MKNNINSFELEEKKTKEFILIIIMGLILMFSPIEGYYLSLLMFGQTYYNTLESIISIIFVQAICIIFISPVIIFHLTFNLPIYKVNFTISEEQIQVYLYDRLFLNYKWENIQEIEVARETYGLLDKGKSNYKIKISTENNTDEIRLYFLRFQTKNRKIIISQLKIYCMRLRKAFNEKVVPEKGDIEKQLKTKREIKKFLK